VCSVCAHVCGVCACTRACVLCVCMCRQCVVCVDVHLCSVVPGYATLVLLFPHPAVKWGPGINWRSSPPSCNIDEYLVITEEANAQLSISH